MKNMPNDAKKNRGQQKKITDELDNELKSIKSKKAFEQWMKENPVGSTRSVYHYGSRRLSVG